MGGGLGSCEASAFRVRSKTVLSPEQNPESSSHSQLCAKECIGQIKFAPNSPAAVTPELTTTCSSD